MKKITIALFLCICVATHVVHGRPLNIGLRIGANTSNLDINSDALKQLVTEGDYGYHAGAFGRLDLALCYVQPEILFSGTGVKVQEDQGAQKMQLAFTKLDVPVMVGTPLLGIARLQIGPVFSILLNAIERTEGSVEKNIRHNYHNLTVGGQAGLGFDFFNVAVDFKYERDLSVFGKEIVNVKTDQRQEKWILSLGFQVL